jgi:hypothetical protein
VATVASRKTPNPRGLYCKADLSERAHMSESWPFMFRIRNLDQSEGELADIRAKLNYYPK